MKKGGVLNEEDECPQCGSEKPMVRKARNVPKNLCKVVSQSP